MKTILLAILGGYVLAAQTIPPVVISDTVQAAVDGVPMVGSLQIQIGSFVDVNGNAHAASSQSVYTDSHGRFSVQLVPNAGSNPPSTYYNVTYHVSGGAASIAEQWLVPVTTHTLMIGQVRVNTNLPLPPFLIPLNQIGCQTCVIASVPTWTGSGFEALPLRALFSGSFTTDSGFHVRVTAVTHGQGPNVITHWRDSSGNDLNPAVVVDPITGDVDAYFDQALSGSYFIDGGQAIPNPSFGFYGAQTGIVTQAQHHFATANLDVAVYDSAGNLINSSAQIQVNPATYAVTVTLGSAANFRVVVMGGMGTGTPQATIAQLAPGSGFVPTPTDPGCVMTTDVGKVWVDNAVSANTVYKLCLAVSGTPQWVTK